MLAHLLTLPCTITTRTDSGTTDPYGNPVLSKTTVETTCELQQQRRTEPNDQGELSQTTWALFLPAGTQVGTGDVVTVDGVEYEFVGDPWQVRHPRTGAEHQIEATVVRTA